MRVSRHAWPSRSRSRRGRRPRASGDKRRNPHRPDPALQRAGVRLSASSARPQEAYFEKINAEGGINGRKIKFISLDDAYSPPKTVEQTRKLVEQDEVLMMFGSLGTATNNAVHRYLNGKKVPQLFVLSGATKWADPKNFRWTMPRNGDLPIRGRRSTPSMCCGPSPTPKSPSCRRTTISAATTSPASSAALGDKAATMIVAEATYETTAPTIASQLATLKARAPT